MHLIGFAESNYLPSAFDNEVLSDGFCQRPRGSESCGHPAPPGPRSPGPPGRARSLDGGGRGWGHRIPQGHPTPAGMGAAGGRDGTRRTHCRTGGCAPPSRFSAPPAPHTRPHRPTGAVRSFGASAVDPADCSGVLPAPLRAEGPAPLRPPRPAPCSRPTELPERDAEGLQRPRCPRPGAPRSPEAAPSPISAPPAPPRGRSPARSAPAQSGADAHRSPSRRAPPRGRCADADGHRGDVRPERLRPSGAVGARCAGRGVRGRGRAVQLPEGSALPGATRRYRGERSVRATASPPHPAAASARPGAGGCGAPGVFHAVKKCLIEAGGASSSHGSRKSRTGGPNAG